MALIDLQMNYPLLDEQQAQLERHLRAAMAEGSKWMEPAPYGGYPEHREAAAEWLSRDGTRVQASRVMIAAGGHSGVLAAMYAAELLGRTIATDTLTYPGFKMQAALMKSPLVGCAGDSLGMRPNELERAARQDQIKGVYLMPTVQNPLGTVMPISRRQEICEVARHYGLSIIDDDAYGFCEARPPANFAMLAPERSYFVQSFTKPCAPALKVAFVVFPEGREAVMETALRSISSGAPALFTEATVRMIRSGEMDQLFADKRKEARLRQTMAEECFRGLKTQAHPTSFHISIDLPRSIPSGKFAAQLAAEGVVVSASQGAAVDAGEANGIRVALGAVRNLNDLKIGLLKVREAIDAAASKAV